MLSSYTLYLVATTVIEDESYLIEPPSFLLVVIFSSFKYFLSLSVIDDSDGVPSCVVYVVSSLFESVPGTAA